MMAAEVLSDVSDSIEALTPILTSVEVTTAVVLVFGEISSEGRFGEATAAELSALFCFDEAPKKKIRIKLFFRNYLVIIKDYLWIL